MKITTALVSVLLITGCSTVPVNRNFPAAPDEIKNSCPDLKTVPQDTTKLSTVLDSVVDNYSTYHECKINNDAWLEW
jgi:PBP1b-binding outer membrane lipoprotein LpoB